MLNWPDLFLPPLNLYNFPYQEISYERPYRGVSTSEATFQKSSRNEQVRDRYDEKRFNNITVVEACTRRSDGYVRVFGETNMGF